MVEIVLMGSSVALLHDVEGGHLRKDNLKESGTLQIFEANAGVWRHHNLVEFHFNALATDDFYTVGHTLQGQEGLFLNLEVQLGGKTDAPHHA